ncbi:MBL fold metallo-hydrolase [Roseateles depolymerans]|uniref:Beta-lactamase n=1 Tax=Roseateles depolymerans TaxID=76731 RepID=A0A0U3MNC2_9BURK|nr:MBL fold metallo-hydrolase [Roseateles depolymerans]ALV05850.1 beta-lactamase [Roseateles depolymerans]REG12878.1 metallo-beta-lactamase superfamily protein [Roseateles depolymerans]
MSRQPLPSLPPLPHFTQALGHGIYAIDTAFQRDHFDAAYLVVDDGRAAFIDTGTRHAVPRLLDTLQAVGLSTQAVDWVIPTHVHLDHAGGVGPLMQQLPSARLLVHPRGLRHMVDPSALWAGALAVYGEEEMQRSYGTLVGVPESRTVASTDEQRVRLGQRELRLIDTPGHARHHHCVWDETSGGWFTGDTFGLSYREFDDAQGRAWILPTSTPVQFEPEALLASLQRLMQTQPRRMFLTHYSAVGRDAADVRRLAGLLIEQIQEMARIARALQDAPERHLALKRELLALYQRGVAAHLGDAMSPEQVAQLLSMDVELNAQGLGVWLDKQRPRTEDGARSNGG